MVNENQVVAEILRQAIKNDQYPFPEEEISKALEKLREPKASIIPAPSRKRANKRKNNGKEHQYNAKENPSKKPFIDNNENKQFDDTHYDDFDQELAKYEALGRHETPEVCALPEELKMYRDDIICQSKGNMPKHLQKYWFNRNGLFSRYDEGIVMDEEGWFSVTPELVARQIAKRMACDTIIDAFCGVGGNSIQFAKVCNNVIAIDNNATRLAFAKHNAKIYGVADKIKFIHGDFFELVSSLKADAIFLSPPWGGPSYNQVQTFDIHTMMPFSGIKLFKSCASITPNIGYFLPRNTDYNQLACLASPVGQCEIEEEYSSKKFIAITAYYGSILKTQ